MAILVVQHSQTCRPGRLGLTLRDHAFKLDIRRVDLGDALPSDLDEVDGVISLGGPQNVDEDHAWLEVERELLRAAHAAQLPIVGICLGHELLAQALGGEVGRSTTPEAGFVDVDILPPGHTDTLLSGIAWTNPQFAHHAYEVTAPPPGAVVLAKSAHCAVQAFKVGLRSYGFQYHFEADQPIMQAIMREASSNPAHDVDDAGMSSQLERAYPTFARLADRLCVNIATCLIPRVASLMRT
ncbi:MAG: type 1 glutamine amidotransferase [Phycisphaerales bacterium]|nr:type 1 glutamine amidotransferase [Phycisphaerales bacterium]